jgi:Protein of unknown function (DUF3137)
MATALRSPHVGSSAPEQRLGQLFRREIAPQLAALDAERAKRRAQFLATLTGCALGVPALTALLWSLDPGWAVAIAVIGLAIAANVLCQQQRSYRHHLRRLVMPAICRAIGEVQHCTGEAPGVPFDDLERLGLLPGHNWRRIDDVFSGRHRGTGFVMAEVLLRERSRGSRRNRSRTVFRGLIFAIEVPREIPGRILIARDSGTLRNRLKGWLKSFSGLARVVLPDPEFEARFEVYADRAEVALSTVSPSVCAALTRLADGHAGRPLQGAFQGRWFYLSMPRAGDQFRLGSLFRSLDGLQQEAGKLLRDIQIVHRVIDTLHGDVASASAAAD